MLHLVCLKSWLGLLQRKKKERKRKVKEKYESTFKPLAPPSPAWIYDMMPAPRILWALFNSPQNPSKSGLGSTMRFSVQPGAKLSSNTMQVPDQLGACLCISAYTERMLSTLRDAHHMWLYAWTGEETAQHSVYHSCWPSSLGQFPGQKTWVYLEFLCRQLVLVVKKFLSIRNYFLLNFRRI